MAADWMTPENLANAKFAWEETDATAAEIGAEFGVSKSAIIGAATRLNWNRRRASTPVSTLFNRMDILHGNMDRVLTDTKGVGIIANAPQKRMVKSEARVKLKMQLSQQARRAKEQGAW